MEKNILLLAEPVSVPADILGEMELILISLILISSKFQTKS